MKRSDTGGPETYIRRKKKSSGGSYDGRKEKTLMARTVRKNRTGGRGAKKSRPGGGSRSGKVRRYAGKKRWVCREGEGKHVKGTGGGRGISKVSKARGEVRWENQIEPKQNAPEETAVMKMEVKVVAHGRNGTGKVRLRAGNGRKMGFSVRRADSTALRLKWCRKGRAELAKRREKKDPGRGGLSNPGLGEGGSVDGGPVSV